LIPAIKALKASDYGLLILELKDSSGFDAGAKGFLLVLTKPIKPEK